MLTSVILENESNWLEFVILRNQVGARGLWQNETYVNGGKLEGERKKKIKTCRGCDAGRGSICGKVFLELLKESLT